MRQVRRYLPLRHAIALGLLQGPTELLPVSSSAHTTLIPWLAGWPYPELDPGLRKSFEVALHAGAATALAINMRGELIDSARGLSRRRIAVIALSLAPPALVGYTLERPIERRLGGSRSIAGGLLVGALAMALADLRPGRWSGAGRRHGHGRRACAGWNGGPMREVRRAQDAGPGDGLALGIAQAVALVPGVSRNGATLTAARARGFARNDSQALSWHAGLPVMLGASMLRAWRLRARGIPAEARPAIAAGAGCAFVSTAASARLLRESRMSTGGLVPYAAYRCMLAVLVLRRLRSRSSQGARER